MKTKVILSENFKKGEFIKWCEENGFDKKDKMALIKYNAEIDSEEAKAMLEAIESGKRSLDDCHFSKMSFDELDDEEVEEGIQYLLKGMLYLIGAKEFADSDDNPLCEIEDRDLIRPMTEAFVMSNFEVISHMTHCLIEGCNLAIDMSKTTMKIKGMLKDLEALKKESEQDDCQA